ncbi:MAG: RHS repeat protein [Deltaproteobacteria bacterium]|nr:RHS repeat protein [Deltaproteobacteria bacterium]
MSATPSVNLPEIPAEVLAPECPLRQVALTSTSGSWSRRTSYTRDGESVWVVLPAGGYANLLRVDLEGGARVAAEYGTQSFLGGLRFDFREPRDRMRWDTAGHLLEVARIEGDAVDVVLTQTWDGDRLVARQEARNVWIGGETVRKNVATTWSYDASGRLTGAAVTGYGAPFTTSIARDDAGRVVSVERRRADVVVERLTWTFDAQNRVAARTVLYDRAAESEDGFSPSSLDDLGATASTTDWLENPWPFSLPVADDADGCLVLPHAVSHGYPAGEHEFDLGMPRDERPNGIGFAYGADTYGWNYGDLSWYSHVGAAGFEPDWGYGTRYEATLTYNAAGRLVHEHATSGGGAERTSDRTRAYDDAGHLVADRVELEVTYPASGDVPETTVVVGRDMTFAWEGGHLVTRELLDDDHGLLERQTWTYDAAGRWASHEVGAPSPITRIYGWAAPAVACGEHGVVCGEPVPERRYEQDVDAAGRQTALRVFWLGQAQGGEPQVDERRFVYDDAGRLVEERQGGSVQRYAYDADGNLILESYDYTDDGTPDYRTETDWDALGRWTEKRSYNAEALVQTERRTFTCE